MDDYYELVGAERTAAREEIDRKIREQLRLWQRRTTNADLTRRQAAERRVQQLGEARTTLLDDEKRRRYDRQLSAYRASDPPPEVGGATATGSGRSAGGATSATTGTWLIQARGFLAANDPQSAAFAARETLRTTLTPPPETWTILARANTELGRLDDALFEAKRAVEADPDNLEAQLALARVHERRQEWVEAGKAYEAASELAPRAEAPQLGLATALTRAGRPGTAVERLERRYAQAGDQVAGGRLLARGLVHTAETVLRPPGGSRAGSSQLAELGLVQRMLTRARQVTTDGVLLGRIIGLEQELARLRTRAPRQPGPRYQPRPDPEGLYPPPQPRTNALAVVALVLAIGGLVTCLTAPIGAILGHSARAQVRDRGERGEGLALAAIIVGWLLTAVICCGGFAIYANS